MNIRIGVDIRGVLAKHEPKEGIVCSTKDYAEAKVMEHALSVLKNLKANYRAEIFLITCIKKTKLEVAVGLWLERNKIFEQLGITIKELNVCSTREEKKKTFQIFSLKLYIHGWKLKQLLHMNRN